MDQSLSKVRTRYTYSLRGLGTLTTGTISKTRFVAGLDRTFRNDNEWCCCCPFVSVFARCCDEVFR